MAEEKDQADRFVYREGDLQIVSPGEGAKIMDDEEEPEQPEAQAKPEQPQASQTPQRSPKPKRNVHVHLYGDKGRK